jgi:prepilin-type N-terminal cleavage/methylation domain-containing protein
MKRKQSSYRGFTLTELAVVLMIVALLIGGMLVPLSAQNDIRNVNETQKTLNDIRDALIGYAAANGRLPCPASASSNGVEQPEGGGDCDTTVVSSSHPVSHGDGNSYAGFVPAATLGITPTDASGYAIDAWGNRIRYAVFPKPIKDPGANPISNPFTAPSGMKTVTLAQLANYTASSGLNNPLLSVCACGAAVTGAGAAATCGGTCAGGIPGKLTDQAMAVVYSLGKNAGTGGTGAGENHNPNPNSTIAAGAAFVWHTPTAAGSADGEFDDLMIWISPNILYNRLIAAGQLP